MSYCRFSSDDWQCDVYVYEHVGGFIAIHVAGSRPDFSGVELPPPVDVAKDGVDELVARYVEVSKILDRVPIVPLDLPCDGETYEIEDRIEAAHKLKELKGMGYNVPDYAIRGVLEGVGDVCTLCGEVFPDDDLQRNGVGSTLPFCKPCFSRECATMRTELSGAEQTK